MTTKDSNNRSFKIKPKKIILRSAKTIAPNVSSSVKTLDGLSFQKQPSLGGYGQDFVLVGGSYKKLGKSNFKVNPSSNIDSLDNIVFEDSNTFIAYTLASSHSVFVCVHTLALCLTNSVLLSSIANVFDTISHLNSYSEGKAKSVYTKLQTAYIAFIENIFEKFELINDYILSDIINELLALLKIARKSLKFLIKLTVTPVLSILVLSITTVGITASTIDTQAISGTSNSQEILFAPKEKANNSLININPLQINESDYTINFTTLKQGLEKSIQNDTLQEDSNNLNNLYTFKIGDNLDNLSSRWNVSKDYIILSNLDKNFFDNSVDFVNKEIYIPSEKSIWLKLNKKTDINNISNVLGLSTATVLTWQPNTSKTNFIKGDDIVIVNTELDAILNQTSALLDDDLIQGNKDVFNQIVEDNETRKLIALQKAEEERIRLEEEAKRIAREEEERVQAEKAEAERVAREEEERAAQEEAQRIADEKEAQRQADIAAAKNISVWPATGTMSRCNLYYHPACDIANSVGTSIVAFRSGTVKEAGWKNGGYGNMVLIDHGGGMESIYMHMSSVSVYPGQYVTAGQYLGGMGSTGNSTGSHLHFSIFLNGVEISPLRYLVWN